MQRLLEISDTYQLPVYQPIRYIAKLSSGRTEPLLVTCLNVADNNIRQEIVLKPTSNVMSYDALCRELLASLIAKKLEIQVAEPVLVLLDAESLKLFEGTDAYHQVKNALGYNFGSIWLGDGYNEFVKGFSLHNKLYKALQIFVFDILIANADRREDKQNLKTYQENIAIFDHESAFGFVFDIFPNKTPWIISEADKGWITKHLFFDALKKYNTPNTVSHGIAIICNYIILRLSDETFWNELPNIIPKEWQQGHEQVPKIITHIKTMVANISIFETELKKMLL